MTLILAWLVALAILAMPAGFWWCCCGPPCGADNFEVRLRGCDAAKVPGGSVTMDGVTVAVDSDSNALFTVGPGTYTITGSGPGYNGGSTSVTITVGCTPSTITLTLTVDSDHTCCLCCTDNIARKVLYLTDDNGTWTLTSIGGCDWRGEATVSKITGEVSWITCSTGGLPPLTCYKSRLTCGATADVTYTYRLQCVGGSWTLTSFVPTMTGTDIANGCAAGSLGDATCYGDIADAPPLPGLLCSGGANVAGGGIFGTAFMTVDEACGIENLALSGSLGWDTAAPSDGYPTSGSVTITS